LASEHSPGGAGALADASALPTRHKRFWRNYLIDRRLQLHYIGAVSLISAAVSALLGWLIWSQRSQASRTISRSLETADFLGADQKAEIMRHLASSDLSGILRMGFVCAGLIAVVSLLLMVVTHRVAGPLHVIGGYFDQLAAGKLPLVHNLRRRDEFKVFHKKFKDMCNVLRHRAEVDIEAVDGFLQACDAAGVDEGGALGHALEELRKLGREKEGALWG
jgi:methyl-accepting chemotaxis protein